MNIRTLMLGTVLACGTSFGAQAADAIALGNVVALDICDSLGLSGLTIGSNDTCLRISGLVKYEFLWGNYENTRYADNFRDQAINFFNPHPDDFNSRSTIDWRLRFEAVTDSEFGPARAWLQLDEDGNDDLQFTQAYVQIGDQTVLSAGLKGTIFDTGDSRVHNNFLGLFGTMATGGPVTGPSNSHVIQISSTVAEGVVVSAGLEGLNSDNPFAVGVVELSGGWGAGHLSVASNEDGEWKLHTAGQFSFDAFDLTTAVAADHTGFWNALVSGQLELDLFTISGGVQYAEGGAFDQQWGAGAQISADVTDTVTINLGSRYLTNTDTAEEIWQVALGADVDITDNLVLDARIGYVNSTYVTAGPDFAYGDVELQYRPGGGVLAVLGAEVNTTGAWRGNFSLEKTF